MSSLARMLFVHLAVAFVMLGTAAIPANAEESFHGKWELNLAKSKFQPGPPPKSQTRTMSAKGDMHETVIETVDAKGKSVSSRSTYRLDGKDYPVSGSGDIDAIAFKKVDENTSRGVLKRDGKVVMEVLRKVSADGKTLTITTKGTTPQGQPTNNVAVFDRK